MRSGVEHPKRYLEPSKIQSIWIQNTPITTFPKNFQTFLKIITKYSLVIIYANKNVPLSSLSLYNPLNQINHYHTYNYHTYPNLSSSPSDYQTHPSHSYTLLSDAHNTKNSPLPYPSLCIIIPCLSSVSTIYSTLVRTLTPQILS